MTLQDRLDELSEQTKQKAPKEALAIMHRATEELRSSGIMERTIKVGHKAPEFALNNADGKAVSLSSLVAKGPTVVSFFRGKW